MFTSPLIKMTILIQDSSVHQIIQHFHSQPLKLVPQQTQIFKKSLQKITRHLRMLVLKKLKQVVRLLKCQRKVSIIKKTMGIMIILIIVKCIKEYNKGPYNDDILENKGNNKKEKKVK